MLSNDSLFVEVIQWLDERITVGRNIFDYDWDICIILDACRHDLMLEFGSSHTAWNHFESVERGWSLASTTWQWAPRTFANAPNEILSNTAYISAQAMVEKMLTSEGELVENSHIDELGSYDSVWEYAAKDHHIPSTSVITERAADYIYNNSYDRVVVHYLQPHAPFPHCLGKYDSLPGETNVSTQNVWQGLSTGEFRFEEVWNDYGKALLHVLRQVERIILAASGKILITSDHGNLLGEYGLYGHPKSILLPPVRQVPWIWADGKNKQFITARSRNDVANDDKTHLRDHLESLGYL